MVKNWKTALLNALKHRGENFFEDEMKKKEEQYEKWVEMNEDDVAE